MAPNFLLGIISLLSKLTALFLEREKKRARNRERERERRKKKESKQMARAEKLQRSGKN